MSSRSDKRKPDDKNNTQRPEDFMDEEDLADAVEAQTLQTSNSYSGLGTTEGDEKRRGLLMDILRSDEDTVGQRLLKKMGWREGQGLGPRVRRSTRLDNGNPLPGTEVDQHLFAPDDTKMVSFTKKNDRKGLGYNDKENRLASAKGAISSDDDLPNSFSAKPGKTKTQGKQPVRGGIGTGVLNDDGSGDDDPYTMGPRISYNRAIGADKRKEKPKPLPAKVAPLKSSNPLLGAKPIYVSKKASNSKSNFRKCHDGRLPIMGFMLSSTLDNTGAGHETRYPLPKVPEGWKPAKTAVVPALDPKEYKSIADVARASQLDPKIRAAILGEQLLPGKSVFDFISPAVRDKLAIATGKSSLPVGRGEAPPTDSLQSNKTLECLPSLSREVALAALGRELNGWMPYADDEPKRARYKALLEFSAGKRTQMLARPPEVKRDDWDRELREFTHAAEVFKPMTGKMASRFTTSSAPLGSSDNTKPNVPLLLSKPPAKPEDPAEAAAKMNMFGLLTRSTVPFYPTRLLCKRFNVPLPPNVQPDTEGGHEARSTATTKPGQPVDLLSKAAMDSIMPENMRIEQAAAMVQSDGGSTLLKTEDVIDVSKNDALEAERAGDAVFQAIFGDDDSDG